MGLFQLRVKNESDKTWPSKLLRQRSGPDLYPYMRLLLPDVSHLEFPCQNVLGQSLLWMHRKIENVQSTT